MKPFRITLPSGTYLLKGEIQKRLDEGARFIIFARNKDEAKALAFQFIAEKVTSSSPRVAHAVFDEIVDLVERVDHDDPRYAELCEVFKEAAGSISIDGAVLVNPQHEPDTLIVSAAEGERKRVLVEAIHQMDKAEGGLKWGDDVKPLNATRLAMKIQSLF